MDCRACKRQMSALLDGELSERECELCRSHLEGCAACREHYGQLETLRELGAERIESEAYLCERILSTVTAEGGKQQVSRHRWRPWAPAALGAAAVIALCIWATGGLTATLPGTQNGGEPERGVAKAQNIAPFSDEMTIEERIVLGKHTRVYSVQLRPNETVEPALEAGFTVELAQGEKSYLVGDAGLLSQLPYAGLAGADEPPGPCLLVITH